MSSLGKCLFRSSVHFKNWILFYFLLPSCMSFSKYVLDISPLSDIWVTIFFFPFILLMVSFLLKPFSLMYGNPLQCSCLENPRDGAAWWAAVYGVTQSRTWLRWLSSSSSPTLFVCLFVFLPLLLLLLVQIKKMISKIHIKWLTLLTCFLLGV